MCTCMYVCMYIYIYIIRIIVTIYQYIYSGLCYPRAALATTEDGSEDDSKRGNSGARPEPTPLSEGWSFAWTKRSPRLLLS